MTRVDVYKNNAAVGDAALFSYTEHAVPVLHDFIRRGESLYRVVAREWQVTDASVSRVHIYVSEALVTRVG